MAIYLEKYRPEPLAEKNAIVYECQ